MHVPFNASYIIQTNPPHHLNNLLSSGHTDTTHKQQDNEIYYLSILIVLYIGMSEAII
jgi:hypothetical protein